MIYFIQQGITGPIKIGFTKGTSALSRIKQMQTGNPEELLCLSTLDGGVPEELSLHLQFHAYRLRGEWFHPSQSILDYIQKHGKPAHTTRALPSPMVKSNAHFLREIDEYALLIPRRIRAFSVLG